MKKSITILIFMCVTTLCYSQKKNFVAEHEFRLGIGSYPILYDSEIFTIGYDDDDLYFPTVLNTYERYKTYRGNRYTIGSISAGYTYSYKKWLSFGATASYAKEYYNYYDRFTDKKIGAHAINNFFISPMVRFTFLNTTYVRLYSQMGLGVAMIVTNDTSKYYGERKTKFGVSGQATFFGIAVGKKVFGFTEIGVGTQGLIIAGIGYRFNEKK